VQVNSQAGWPGGDVVRIATEDVGDLGSRLAFVICGRAQEAKDDIQLATIIGCCRTGIMALDAGGA
jgi:hypothetical protein